MERQRIIVCLNNFEKEKGGEIILPDVKSKKDRQPFQQMVLEQSDIHRQKNEP